MVKSVIWGVLLLTTAAFDIVIGADLTLKNGQVYKNYRIKAVEGNKAAVLYITDDGSPDIAEINVALLPDNIAGALGIDKSSAASVPAVAVSQSDLPEHVAAKIASQLKIDLLSIAANDVQAQQAAEAKATEDLKKNLSPYSTDAEFETVWNGSDGIIARVLRIHKSGYMKVGDKVFIRSSSQLGNRFRAKVYATGCMTPLGSKEMLRVVTFDEASAVKFAVENIFSAVGRNESTKNSAADKNKTASVAPADQSSVPQVVQPVIYNYYLDDDDDDDVVYVVRDGRRYFPPYRPGNHRPAVRPGTRPHRPGERPGERPGRHPEKNPGSSTGLRPHPNRPESGNKFTPNKSIIQRSDKKIQSYDHLPDWALPRYSRP